MQYCHKCRIKQYLVIEDSNPALPSSVGKSDKSLLLTDSRASPTEFEVVSSTVVGPLFNVFKDDKLEDAIKVEVVNEVEGDSGIDTDCNMIGQ